MKMKHALLGVAAMVGFAAANATAQTGTLNLAIVGSSAQFLELGQASSDATVQKCNFSDATKTDIEVLDDRTGTNKIDSATWWVTWTVGTGGTSCENPGTSGIVVNLMLNTDSVVGNRAFFGVSNNSADSLTGNDTVTTNTPNGQGAVIYVANVLASSITAGNLLKPYTDQPSLPQTILDVIRNTTANGATGAPSPNHFNVAASDIRPEDAKFAINRVEATCGSPVVAGSNFLGLGYADGSTINGSGTSTTPGYGSSFNVLNFNITGNDPYAAKAVPTFGVTTLGAVPVVFIVNPSDVSGFGNLGVSNLTSAQLEGFLDGTFGSTADAGATGSVATTVFVREPLSGTYNTVEYNIPNTNNGHFSSQDAGKYATASGNPQNPLATYNCPIVNPLAITGGGGGSINRAIGTGNEIKSVLNTADSLGYGFWSAANFANATTKNAKYLTVDGVDPIQEIWSDGQVPVGGLLGNVSLSHVKDGTYPVWSILRLVSATSVQSAVQTLATEAANFLSPTQPDFVAATQLSIVRSHFTPDGVSYPSAGTGVTQTPANTPSNGAPADTTENGGDVGGIIFTNQQDADYDGAAGATGGITGRRH
jgi:hypothetical protein